MTATAVAAQLREDWHDLVLEIDGQGLSKSAYCDMCSRRLVTDRCGDHDVAILGWDRHPGGINQEYCGIGQDPNCIPRRIRLFATFVCCSHNQLLSCITATNRDRLAFAHRTDVNPRSGGIR